MKDYKKLQQKINSDKQIAIGDITDLGYSRYDINLFIEAEIYFCLGNIEQTKNY
jgi:hypothetical protein